MVMMPEPILWRAGSMNNPELGWRCKMRRASEPGA